MQPLCTKCGRGCHGLDPPLHGRRVHLHSNRVRHPCAPGELLPRPVCAGDPKDVACIGMMLAIAFVEEALAIAVHN